MDVRIASLFALCLLDKNQSHVPDVALRHLRVILSSFGEELLSEDEYDLLISSLETDKYIDKRDNSTSVTREGVALVRALSERILGQTSLDRLERMIEDYDLNPTSFIQKLNERLKSLQERREGKIKQMDKSLIRAVGLLIEIQHKQSESYVHEFKLDPQVMRNAQTLDGDISYSVRKFVESKGYPVIHRRTDDKLHIISPSRIPIFDLAGHELHPAVVETIRREDVPEWNLQFTSTFIETSLRKLGYLRSRWPGRTFIKYQQFDRVPTNLGILRECAAFNIDFADLKNNHIFVWLESYTSPTKRTLDFLEEHIHDLTNKTEIVDCLSHLRLRSIPSGSEVELKDVLPAQDMELEKIPTTNRTYAEYWRETHGIVLTSRLQPILVVMSSNRDFAYPAEMIYIDRYSLEKRLGESQIRRPRLETPKERFERAKDLFFSIKSMGLGPLSRFAQISPLKFTPTVEELCEFGAFRDGICIHPPTLEFRSGSVSLDPLDVFDAEYGPVCERKDIAISHLLLPSHKSDKEIDTFAKELGKAFRNYGFGNIRLSPATTLVRYDPNQDKSEFEKNIRNLEKAADPKALTIAIIPDRANDYYYSLKRLLPPFTGTPLQCITLSTFDEVTLGTFPGFRFLCLGILIKALDKGESIWNLTNSAGLSQERTLFVGIGFSRFPREGRVSKCAAVLHDARGYKVSWEVFSTPQERAITKQWFDTLLFRIRAIVEAEKPSRLVFYRTGQMYAEEFGAVESSLKNCRWLDSIRISFVSILDAGNSRFYLYDKNRDRYQNIPAGYALIVNDKEALLSTSNYDDRMLKQGTIIPIRLRLEIGNDSIIDLLKEYHDLTYLNWHAPGTTAKHPLVVTIAEKFADLTREGVPAESMFYLDL